MNTATSASPAAPLSSFRGHYRRRIPPTYLLPSQSLSLPVSSSLSRRRGRRRPPSDPDRNSKPSSSDRDIDISIDFADFADRASATATRLVRSSELTLRRFLTSGAEAFGDLRTSVRIDSSRRIVFSCRRSSILFVWSLFVWTLAIVVAVRFLVRLGVWRKLGFGDGWTVIRRDRSLGGREVIVGKRVQGRGEGNERSFRASVNPLSPGTVSEVRTVGENLVGKRIEKKEKLPEWWPESVSSPRILAGKEEFQREADRLVRAIVDNRMSGKDYRDDDIIQLRQICRVSGAKVSFETANARDSFYRASVDFVLNVCSRVTQPTQTIQIDGEEARKFISGLADNIGIENIRAARIICAAVAARTRSCFLQSWALEVQGKRPEALEELAKICRIHQVFPPEEYSPEMEMVASGLKRSMGIEQRKHLLTLLKGVCGFESQRTAEEALGLVGLV